MSQTMKSSRADMTDHVTIIAEAGVNHNGDIGLAKALVGAAATSGADIVKFQTFRAQELTVADAPKAEYQKKTTDNEVTARDLLTSLEMSAAMHEEIHSYCDGQNIEFASSAFDLGSCNLLDQLGVKRFKVPSGEVTNLPLLRHIGQMQKPVILSTGMCEMSEISNALDALIASGAKQDLITILHCNTEYPTPLIDVNLRAIATIQSAFGFPVGYSDHTKGIEVAIAAVAMGATMIEKHLTMDSSLVGPDHSASLEPKAFGEMVSAIRNVELALGGATKRPSQSELANREVVRKSIVASKSIKKGEILSTGNLTTKRPASGICPMQWDKVVGTPSKYDFSKDELIEI